MIDSSANGKSTDEPGKQSVQDNTPELRILPYYCSWYRGIFPRKTPGLPLPGSEKSAIRTPGD